MARHTIDGTEWKNPSTVSAYMDKIVARMESTRGIIASAKEEGRSPPSWNPERKLEFGLSQWDKPRMWTAARKLVKAGIIVVAYGNLDDQKSSVYFVDGPNFPKADI